jgi:hypothetical protein
MSQKRSIVNYVAAYLLWIVSTGLGLFALYRVRETILLSMVFSNSLGNPSEREIFYSNLRAQAVQSWTIMLGGFLMLLLLVGIENFYRMSVPNGKLVQRFFLVSMLEVIVLFLAHAAYYAMLTTFRVSTWTAYTFPIIEILIVALFFWLYRQQRKKGRIPV